MQINSNPDVKKEHELQVLDHLRKSGVKATKSKYLEHQITEAFKKVGKENQDVTFAKEDVKEEENKESALIEQKSDSSDEQKQSEEGKKRESLLDENQPKSGAVLIKSKLDSVSESKDESKEESEVKKDSKANYEDPVDEGSNSEGESDADDEREASDSESSSKNHNDTVSPSDVLDIEVLDKEESNVAKL